jgi:hypothetical protein
MSEEEIVWHYNEFVEIQVWVERKLKEKNLNANNESHHEQIKEIIRETVLEFKRLL